MDTNKRNAPRELNKMTLKCFRDLRLFKFNRVDNTPRKDEIVFNQNLQPNLPESCEGKRLLYNHVQSTIKRAEDAGFECYHGIWSKNLANSRNRIRCYQSTWRKLMKLKVAFRLLCIDLERELNTPPIVIVKKPKPVKVKRIKLTVNRVIHEVDDVEATDLEKSVKLFQRMLRGRAYQTMMLMAEIRYEQYLNESHVPRSLTSIDCWESVAERHDDRAEDDWLERSKMVFINNYFDTISKEYTMKTFVDELAKQLNEVIQCRNIVEAVESNRRAREIVQRRNNSEKLKQALKTHGDVCQLLFETVTKNAIRSSATRLAGKTIELILDGRQDMTDDDEEYRVIDRCDGLYREDSLLMDLILPEVAKINNDKCRGKDMFDGTDG